MEQDSQRQAAYTDGYDFGFAHPHIPFNRAAKHMRTTYAIYKSIWLKGFKEGKAATGITYGKHHR